MHCSQLTAISVILLCCTHVRGDNYLLRLETTGFRDSPQHGEQPTPEILESIEIVARVDQPFYGNTTIGSARIAISGTVEQLDDGRFRVQVRSRKSANSEGSIPGPNGRQIPMTKSSSINTTAIVKLNEAAELGKDDGIVRINKGTELVTKTRTVLLLGIFDPAKN